MVLVPCFLSYLASTAQQAPPLHPLHMGTGGCTRLLAGPILAAPGAFTLLPFTSAPVTYTWQAQQMWHCGP